MKLRVPWMIAALFLASTVWLGVKNRELEAALHARTAGTTVSQPAMPAPNQDPWRPTQPRPAASPVGQAFNDAPKPPALPSPPEESRMERRVRRSEELAAMFGRLDGESAEAYQARVAPMISLALAKRRDEVKAMRAQAEAAANVTPAQSQALDAAFAKTYTDVIEYTNAAVAAGQISPYSRNVSGWLEYAGGLGGLLNDAERQVGAVLAPEQLQALQNSGFEWGEYLGTIAPWETLKAPPPRPRP